MTKITQRDYAGISIYRQKEHNYDLRVQIELLQRENKELKALLEEIRDRFVSVTTNTPLGENDLTLLAKIGITLDE